MTKLRELSSDLKRKYKYECSNRNCGMIFRYPVSIALFFFSGSFDGMLHGQDGKVEFYCSFRLGGFQVAAKDVGDYLAALLQHRLLFFLVVPVQVGNRARQFPTFCKRLDDSQRCFGGYRRLQYRSQHIEGTLRHTFDRSRRKL